MTTPRGFDPPWKAANGDRPTADVRGFHGRAPNEMSTYPPGWRADPSTCTHSQFLDNESPVMTVQCMDCGCEVIPGSWQLKPGGRVLTVPELVSARLEHARIFELKPG